MIRVRGEEVLLNLKKQHLQGFKNLGGLASQQFSNLFNAYSKAYNKMYHWKGSLFIPYFRRKLIDSDSYF
jgi:putative transposase